MPSRIFRSLFLFAFIATALPAYAQQTGVIVGKVADSGGGVLPGVTVEARADVLPVPRVTTTGVNGEYRLVALPPGKYTLTFVLAGMQNVTRQAEVQLGQDTTVDATLGIQGVTEAVEVTATATMIEKESATIKSGVSSTQISALPVGQEYRNLLKLIPAVQYSQDSVRGPSAGGSGQDNIYQFDGVNVTLPLFGTLAADPSTHDVAQATTVRGGARAIDFDRSGGFLIDTISKSGTNRFSGEVSYQFQNASMTAPLDDGSPSRYEQDRTWITASVGGPVIPSKLFFYGSYYRPEVQRDNRANNYGELPEYKRTRDEGFGKLTFTPTSSVLLNFSYRGSDRTDLSDLFGASSSATTGTGGKSNQTIGIAEGSWVINSRSLLTFKYNRYALETQGTPDYIANVTPSSAVGTRLDTNSLDTLGNFSVPILMANQPAYNAFVQPLIDRYGYVQNGARFGGGIVGYGSQFDDNDFFRDAGQIGYNITFSGALQHDLHLGYQQYVDSEDLLRSSNGWGLITAGGGRTSFSGTPIFYTARIQQQSLGAAVTHSEYHSLSFEVNDTIRYKDWTFNVGVLASHDTLWGQGLREDENALSGFVSAPGNKYKMYSIPFGKMIQPRVSTTWAYNGNDTVYASYARYNPAASSLPRAASWDRNLISTFVDNFFDANGVLFAATPVASSSGKLFVPDMTPRTIDEYMVGTAKQFNRGLIGRFYWRYRDGSHFWEDTNNNARVAFNPPDGIPRELYIANLSDQLAQIGSGSTYVIADLDTAYTEYYEATAEAEWRSSSAFVRGSYTWSHYYGNFDQDNSTAANDANVFIGSSFIGDGAGRQLWDLKDGDLRGDRRHVFKLYGYYNLKWNATAGAFVVAQSGQPWETWNYEVYIPLVGTSTSDTNRYAETAGSRRSSSHAQLDLKYVQNFRLGGRLNLQLDADLFNIFDNQTGYNYQPSVHTGTSYATPRNYYDPTQFQLAARFRF